MLRLTRAVHASRRTLTDVADLHPGIAFLAPLVGTWAGQGAGEYPTIQPFGYSEEVTFGHAGKPFLTYSQQTTAGELVLANPTGITEIQEGTLSVSGATVGMELNATAIGRTTSAKDVTALSRSIRIDGDELTYTLRPGAVGQPLQHHLAATLHRKPA